MLKERASNSKSTYDPYDCALQLKKVLENSNVAPIMTIVIFDLLSKVDLDEIAADAHMYEYIMNSFNEKISYALNLSDKELNQRSKAYLILLLEIISHAKLVTGIKIDMQPICDLSESDVSVQLHPRIFRITKKGQAFIKSIEEIKVKCLVNSELVKALSDATMKEIDSIIERYKDADGYESGDVIIIDKVQA